MNQNSNSKPFDLERRAFEFARDVRSFVRQLPYTIANVEDARQLIRASGSVGANYIEANESLGKKDLQMRLRISRKEAKESRYWLGLLFLDGDVAKEKIREELIREATELLLILSAILNKTV